MVGAIEVGRLQDQRALVIQPDELPVRELLLVELIEDHLRVSQLRGHCELLLGLERPVTTGQNLNIKLNILHDRRVLVVLDEVIEQIFRLVDIGNHGLDLAHDVVAALNLQLLDDTLLGLVVLRQLVQQAVGEQK